MLIIYKAFRAIKFIHIFNQKNWFDDCLIEDSLDYASANSEEIIYFQIRTVSNKNKMMICWSYK